jgi:hypothetical protein
MLSGLLPVLEALADDVDLTVRYIGRVAADGQLTSLYGDRALAADLVGVCTLEHGGTRTWRALKACELSGRGADQCLDVLSDLREPVLACARGEQGKTLLRASYEASRDAEITGSPTLRIAGAPFAGGRSTAHLARALCQHTASATDACKRLSQAPDVDVLIVGEDDCAADECERARFEAFARWSLAGARVKHVSPQDRKVREIMEDPVGTPVPFALVGANVAEDTSGFEKLARLFSGRSKQGHFVVPLQQAAAPQDGALSASRAP